MESTKVAPEEPYATAIPQAPITQARPPFVPSSTDVATNFGTVRATVAASRDHPNGTIANSYAEKNRHRTVLQQHCDYWDTDRDSVIWPGDTYLGVRKWGWNPLLCIFVVVVINGGLSYPTVSGILPDPFFRIYLDRIHQAKHGSDSQTYDTEGRFSPQHFEDIFTKYDRDNKGGLTLADLWNIWNGYRVIFDFFGASAVAFEWIAVYLLLWPEDGVMKKEDLRGVYDGSMFYRKAEERRSASKQASWTSK